MNKIITIHDAKTNLSKYIKLAKAGTPIYIGGYGQQEVVLMAAKPQKTKIIFGTAAGKFKLTSDNLEGTDPDIQKLFYGNNS